MKDLPERPAIRPIEVKETVARGEPAFVLKDPLRLADQVIVLPMVGIAVAELLDGTRTIPEVAEEFERRHKVKIGREQIEGLLSALDEVCLLEGGRARSVIAAWSKEPVRKPACAGPNGSYPGDRLALGGFLDAQYTRQGGPGAPPDRSSRARPVRSLLSPHIDFHRGGHAYAHAWKPVAESCEADLFVVFGTAHAGTDAARFALTRKSYETPLGTIETDAELVDRLVSAYEGPDDLFAGEFAHKGEHSIEFQMVELAHIFGPDSPAPRKIKALPVLCGSIHDLAAKPSEDPRVRAFHDALAKALVDTKAERICFVGGVDLAHVGKEFGDRFKLTAKKLESYLEQDRATLDIITKAQDADAFHADVALDASRKICGHSPIHALLAAQERRGRSLAGEVLCHDSHDCFDEGASAVSFCSVVFRDGKKRK